MKYYSQQLKGISETVDNELMVEFMKSFKMLIIFEGLMLELLMATIVDLIINDMDFRDFKRKGYISLDDVEGWGVCNYTFNGGDVGILFTGSDVITRCF